MEMMNKKYGPPNAKWITSFNVVSGAWEDGKTFVGILGYRDSFNIYYRDFDLGSLHSRLNEMETIGRRLKAACVNKLKSKPWASE